MDQYLLGTFGGAGGMIVALNLIGEFKIPLWFGLLLVLGSCTLSAYYETITKIS